MQHSDGRIDILMKIQAETRPFRIQYLISKNKPWIELFCIARFFVLIDSKIHNRNLLADPAQSI